MKGQAVILFGIKLRGSNLWSSGRGRKLSLLSAPRSLPFPLHFEPALFALLCLPLHKPVLACLLYVLRFEYLTMVSEKHLSFFQEGRQGIFPKDVPDVFTFGVEIETLLRPKDHGMIDGFDESLNYKDTRDSRKNREAIRNALAKLLRADGIPAVATNDLDKNQFDKWTVAWDTSITEPPFDSWRTHFCMSLFFSHNLGWIVPTVSLQSYTHG